MAESFCIKKRIQSFGYAIKGVFVLVQSQHNAWIHSVATVLVLGGGIFFHVSRTDWIFLFIAIAMVWIAEALNTSIEFLSDRTTTEQDPLIEKAKDVAAGSVLIAAIAAATIGFLVFAPYLKSL